MANSTVYTPRWIDSWEDDERKCSARFLTSSDNDAYYEHKSITEILKEMIDEEREKLFVEYDEPIYIKRSRRVRRHPGEITVYDGDCDDYGMEYMSDTDSFDDDRGSIDNEQNVPETKCDVQDVSDTPERHDSVVDDSVMEKVVDDQVYRKFGYV